MVRLRIGEIGLVLVIGCGGPRDRLPEIGDSATARADSGGQSAVASAPFRLEGDSMQPGRSAPPRRFAVVEHTSNGARMMLVDLRTGERRLLPETDGEPRQPVWSPDGRELLYRVADTLFWYREAADSAVPAVTRLNPQTATPYGFSPDGQLIAATMLESVFLLRPADLPVNKTGGRVVPMPSGCRMADLSWTPDGDQVIALCYPSPGTQAVAVLVIPVRRGRAEDPGSAASRYVGADLGRLLGWQRGTGSLLLTKSGETEQIVALAPGSSAPSPVGTLPSGEFAVAFIPASEEVVTARAVEDEGDPATVQLVRLGHSESRPWLLGFPRLSDLSITADGAWAMFVDRVKADDGGAGGNVYLVPVGHGAAQLVLQAEPGKVSYTAPVPWP